MYLRQPVRASLAPLAAARLRQLDTERAALLAMFPCASTPPARAHAQRRMPRHWTQKPENRQKMLRTVRNMTAVRLGC